MSDTKSLMRYAQLIFKHVGLKKSGNEVPLSESKEIRKIRKRTGLSHDEIMQKAKSLLVK